MLPVQQLSSGDHAFVSYGCDHAARDIVTTFAWMGLAQQEKVVIFAPPQLKEEEVWARIDVPGPLVADARRRGQLAVSSMRTLIHPQDRFTAARQWQRIEEETDQALDEGYRGLRTYIDMHWVPDLSADVDVMMHRETHADHLFADRPYTEICAYDTRWFAPDVLEAMHHAHPTSLLSHTGALHTESSPHGLRLVGEADVATREQFNAALRKTLAGKAQAGQVSVDMSRLVFLSAACAEDLVQLTCDASSPEHVRVLCRPQQAHLLRRVGAEHLSHLVLSEVSC
ncbi:MEDS domain-containing protein [Streptomyces niger]|uniref:MEDS domain-containing protein n=1 Tax=Streptomyces niger TaxID=66373 RepID=UPI00069B22D2|nr:MEDS domain-containing protein [Streptomyces niger]